MGILGDVKNWWDEQTGANSRNAGQAAMSQAATNLSGQGSADPASIAAMAAQAGQKQGEQQGQTAAQMGTQAAIQAARTAGLNKGQGALVGSQQAGRLFTQGQQAGQAMGQQAYQTAAAQRIAANAAMAQAGQAQYGAGQQGGQDFWGGISKLAQGVAMAAMAKGGVVTKPTQALIGEKGPEAVLPLNDAEATSAILKKIGLRKGAEEAMAMSACPHCGKPMNEAKEKKDASS